MLVELRLGGLIKVNGRDIAVGQTLAILDAVARDGSVSGAAERLGVSYRSAWGRVLALEETFGQPLVRKTKGHGSVLTGLGEEVRQALQAPFRAMDIRLTAEQQRLQARLAGLLGSKPPPLRIAASHDPLLIETLKERRDVELTVAGSEQAIQRLLAGAADVAGCHFGPGTMAAHLPAPLREPAYAVRPVFSREQGLMVAAGNPLKIRSVMDLARRQARFVNRQKGSGTRAWFDRLLEEADIPPSDIVGYEAEEFTHQAVGALIKSGVADAGLGVRAVAGALGLGFIPIGQEAYFLASRADLGSALLDQIVAELQGRARAATGYSPSATRQRRRRRSAPQHEGDPKR